MFANEGGISPGGVPIRHNDVAGHADLLGEAIAFWHRSRLSEARTALQSRPNGDQQCAGYNGDVYHVCVDLFLHEGIAISTL